MAYRDELLAARSSIEVLTREKEELLSDKAELQRQKNVIQYRYDCLRRSRLEEKKMKFFDRVPRWTKITALITLLLFLYVPIGGIVAAWTEKNFCPCTDPFGIVMSGAFWPVAVLVNIGKVSYDYFMETEREKESANSCLEFKPKKYVWSARGGFVESWVGVPPTSARVRRILHFGFGKGFSGS
jgi:hypothetical protein